jgi:two-component system KDP operon response regulator KdpE
MKKPKILIVDNEPETLKYVGANLRARGYDVLTADDGRTALKATNESMVDLIVLDIMMPGIDGFEVCRAMRQHSGVPILMLSARGREQDIVHALDLGADDYLTKPFGVEELLARVRAVLRRTAQTSMKPGASLRIGDLAIDSAAQRVTVRDHQIQLTSTEYELLTYLAANAGRVLTHRVLLQAVWGPEYGDETEYLWAYIRRLRRKIELDASNPRYILTQPGVPGVGYYFVAPA